MRELVVVALAYGLGSIPFSNIVARIVAGADLREVGTGTVSGTALYRVAGFVPLAIGGILDIAKAVPAVLLAGDRPLLASLAASFAVLGHNWSPVLGFAGGRGLSAAMGGYLVIAWPAVIHLLAGLAIGRLARHTGLVSFIAICTLPFLLAATSGGDAALAACLIGSLLLLKRVTGNTPLPTSPDRSNVAWRRLVFDNDGTAEQRV